MFYLLAFFFLEVILINEYAKGKCYNTSFISKGGIKVESDYAGGKRSSFIFFLILFVTIYFVTFRDGLGQDYTAYQSYCERNISLFTPVWLSEPIPRFIYNFCYETRFSAIVFFGIAAIVIYTLTFYVYSRYKEFPFIILIFFFYSDIFISSLNLVSQFMAASLFLFGAHYYISGKTVNRCVFLVCIIISFFIHKSTIILLPIAFISYRKFNPIIIAIALIASIILPIGELLNNGFIGQLIKLLDYESYLNYNNVSYSKFSAINMFMHLCIIPFLMYYNRVIDLKDDRLIFAIKMFAFYLICNNLSANGLPIFYRMGPYFVLFVPIILSYLPKLIKFRHAKFFILSPLIFLLFFILFSRVDDRIYVPNKILPIESIFDENYHPYDNPNVVIVV